MGRARPFGGVGAKLLALCVSTVFVLGVGELAVRVGFPEEVDADQLRAAHAANVTRTFTRASGHPELVFELRPGVDVEWHGTRVTIDAEGAGRIDPAAPPPADPDVRIAIVGDSTAFGWGVEHAESYGSVLQQRLAARSGKTVYVRNFAVPGNNSHHNWIAFRDRVLPWSPDLVILHYDHNDAEATDEQPHDYMGPEFGDNPLGSALWKWLARRAFIVKNRYFAFTELAPDDDPNRYEGHARYAGPQYDKSMDELAKMATAARARGIPLLAFVFNAWLEASEDPKHDPVYVNLHARAAARLRAMGFVVLDMYTPAQALMHERGWKDLSALQVSRADGHPNAEMHRWIADRMVETIAGDATLSHAAGLE